MSEIEYNTNRANSGKGQRYNLLRELEEAKRDLIQLTQYTMELEATGDITQDNLRTATIARVCQPSEQNIILSTKEGFRGDQNDAAIYANEMELLPQEIKVKMNILNQIQNRIESLEQEEARIRDDIHKMMIEGEMEHGVLSQRLVEIDRLDKTLMELQQDLM